MIKILVLLLALKTAAVYLGFLLATVLIIWLSEVAFALEIGYNPFAIAGIFTVLWLIIPMKGGDTK